MNAREHLDRGDLAGAIGALTEEVKGRPADLRLRTFLVELHAFAGDLDRAERQLDVIRRQGADAEIQGGVIVYQGLLAAERARRRLFDEGVRPRFILAPPADVLGHLEAVELLREGRHAEARERLDRAAAEATPIRGASRGAEFEEFRDADDLLAPVLEVFASSAYHWVPWAHIQYLEVPAPKNLLDLIWTPAKLATHDGQLGEVYVPSLYPGSSSSADDLVRLGRKTEWVEAEGGIVRGLGRKLLLVGDDARTLLELEDVRFTYTAGPGDAPAAAEGEAEGEE